MILLDTNVITELMKPAPAEAIIVWVAKQITGQLFISTITIAEIAYGLQVLPQSKRRRTLEIAFQQTMNKAFFHRILEFDEQSAYLYGEIMGHRKKLGRPMSVPDGQISAIAQRHGAILATRNIKDFKHNNIELVNPFNDET